MIKKPEGQQHHGNLKEALVIAGLQILKEEGLLGLSLRKCAARAGVSHAAPAHHFKGVSALKSAIAAKAYGIFEDLMKQGIAEAGPAPSEKIQGMCRGYLRFASEHEALFNLIFVHRDTLPEDEERERAAVSARQVLIDVCTALSPEAHRLNVTEVAVWSLVHGYAKLIEIGRVEPGSGDARDVGFDEVFRLLATEPSA